MLEYPIIFLTAVTEWLCLIVFCLGALCIYQCTAWALTKKFKYARINLTTFELMKEFGAITVVLVVILVVIKLCGGC